MKLGKPVTQWLAECGLLDPSKDLTNLPDRLFNDIEHGLNLEPLFKHRNIPLKGILPSKSAKVTNWDIIERSMGEAGLCLSYKPQILAGDRRSILHFINSLYQKPSNSNCLEILLKLLSKSLKIKPTQALALLA